MSSLAGVLATVVPAYLLGAMPWGLWVGRVRGVDIREIGSGNLGATNVYRQLGPLWGIAVLLLDIGKGVAAVYWGRSDVLGLPFPGGPEVAGLLAGLCAIFGHVFTVFAGFRGGKGVATTVGVFLALTPKAMLIGLGVWLVVAVATRRVSAASLALAVVYPIGIYLTEHGDLRGWLLALGSVISLLIILRHVGNIKRLLRGTEPPFALGGRAPDAPGAGAGEGRSDPK
jgi:glycerol-3-phosphate acyltransferase PlsY